MSQKTDAELITEAEVIRDETTELANTKTRVYNMFKNLIDSKPNNTKDHFRGAYNASGNAYPTTGGSSGGVPQAGDEWYVSVAGSLDLPGNPGTPIEVGAILKALVNTPGQTATNWKVIQ